MRCFHSPRWLGSNMPPRTPSDRIEDVTCFYRALRRLEHGVGGTRRLSRCDGRTGWPERGVYFFFEAGEMRAGSGEGLRVVRVGTHALASGSRTSLWGRLRDHRGGTAGGKHRGSIFRLLVGAALAARDPRLGVDTWGYGSSAPRGIRSGKTELERLVSGYITAVPTKLYNGLVICCFAGENGYFPQCTDLNATTALRPLSLHHRTLVE